MSNESPDGGSENKEAPESTAASAATPQPRTLKVYGREFDVSTDVGLTQAQTWAEAMSTLAGRQSTEVGKLRKFVSEHQPKGTESEILTKARKFAAEGEPDRAIELMFDHSKEIERKAQKRIETERHNSELWEEYLSTRPDLDKKLGRQKIRQVSENALDLYSEKVDDVFTVLDDFWKPFMAAEQTSAAPAKPRTEDKPPVTLSGGAAKPAAQTPASSSDSESFFDILDKRSLSRR